jgi:hypothetical protein
MAGREREAMIARTTRADLATWVAHSRAAQGLPPKVTDPALVAQVVALLLAGRDGPDTTTPRGRRTPRRRDHSAGQQEGHRDATRQP